MPTPDDLRRMQASCQAGRLKGGAVVAKAARISEHEAKTEKKLQGEIANYLRLHGIWYDQDGMQRRRSGAKGAPDFQFPYRGFYVAWEVKTDTGKLRPEQIEAGEKIVTQGGKWRVIHGIAEAQAHLRELDAMRGALE